MNIYQSFILIPFFTFSQVDTIYFTSGNPFSFKDIIENLESQEEQQVYGILKFPKKLTKTKVPLIIAFSGSEGWADHHYEYLKIYRELGIATFEVCSFKSRGVLSTVGSQTDITTAMMVLDGYKAFEALSQHININSKNI